MGVLNIIFACLSIGIFMAGLLNTVVKVLEEGDDFFPTFLALTIGAIGFFLSIVL